MKIFFRNLFIIGCLSAIAPFCAIASDALQVKVANMSQDLSFLTKELAQLRLETETLNRENQALKKQLEQIQLSSTQLKGTQNKQDAQIACLNAALDSYKKTLLNQVSDEMEQFSKQTQKAIDQISKSVAPKSVSLNDTLKFSDDYSKEGIAYTVQRGDSLSMIAQKQGATVRDIQNANRIADPRELKAGQVIFIPTKK